MGKIDMTGLRKFGAKELGPLYCSLSANFKGNKDLVLFGGGAGGMHSGIANRLVICQLKDGLLPEGTLVNQQVGEELPTRMTLHPDGSLVCIFSNAPRVFEIQTKKEAKKEKEEKESEEDKEEEEEAETITGLVEVAEKSAKLKDFKEQKCCEFSKDGTMLAFGSEEGHVKVVSWPAMKTLWDCAPVPSERGNKIDKDKPGHTKAVTDILWSPEDAFLLTISSERAGPNTGAIMWGVEREGESVSLKLAGYLWDTLGAAKWTGSFRGGSFSSSKEGLVVVGFNNNGLMKGPDSFLCKFDVASLKCKEYGTCTKDGKITSLALSPDHRTITSGTSEGEALVHSTESLKNVLKFSHLVFTTSVCYSLDGSTAVSTSADGSARCISIPANLKTRSTMALLLHLIVAILVLLAAAYYQQVVLKNA